MRTIQEIRADGDKILAERTALKEAYKKQLKEIESRLEVINKEYTAALGTEEGTEYLKSISIQMQ